MRAGPNAQQFPNRIVTTDSEGRYEIKGLPAGTYVINATSSSACGRSARHGSAARP